MNRLLPFNPIYRGTICLVLLALGGAIASAQAVPSEYFNALQWRLIGPFRGGRTIAGVGVPAEPNTFFFGSVDGGVFKSIDAGLTWTPITDGTTIASVGAMAIAPSDPQIIYVATGETDIRSNLASGDGVYKSSDGGRTWKNIGLRDTRQIARILVDPKDPDVVYVGALGYAYGPNDERGVYKSTDGGATWKLVLDRGPQVGISDLTLASANPNVLFAGTWNAHRPPWSTYAPIDGHGNGLVRSTDGGTTWTDLKGHGLPDGAWQRVGVSVAPDGKRVYALIAVQGDEANKKSGLYRSDDGGTTWTLMNSDKRLTSRAWYFDWLTVDPSNPDVVYVPNVALYRTEDGGKTISIVRGAPGGDDYHDLWVDPTNPSHLMLTTDQGASVSLDRGKTWSSWYNQPAAQMYHVTTDDEFPYTVLGAQQDSGAIGVKIRSDQSVLSTKDWVNVGGGESAEIAVDPKDSNILYATSAGGSVVRYDRRTGLSHDISPWPMPNWGVEINERKYRAPWTPPIIFSPADKKTLYFGTQFVMKTLDGGLHWESISPDLTGAKQGIPGEKPTVLNATAQAFGVVYALAPSPLSAEQIWAGTDTGLIHLTTDGGKTWKNVTPAGITDWSRISMIAASRYDAGTAYAAVDRHRLNDLRPYIYRTRDLGKTWRPVASGIADNAFVRAIREDPAKRGLLYAGTERGMYVSFNDGEDWQALQLNLPMSAIYDVAVHGDDLIAATHGRSFWVLDGISSLRQAASQQVNAKAWLYAPGKTYRIDNDSFLGTPLPPEEPQAKNPPDGALIDYVLRTGASSVTLEIYDSSNQLVRKFSNTDKKPKHGPLPIAERWFPEPQLLETSTGMHRFVWDLRWSTSGDVIDDDADMAAPPKGPRAVPGEYTLKLTVDGQPFTQELNVAMDPRNPATAAELAEQLRVGREIYSATMLSRRAMASTGTVQKQLQSAQAKVAADKELASRITVFLGSLQRILKGDKTTTGLDDANKGLLAALRAVESGDRTPTAASLELFRESKQAFETRNAQWEKLKSELPPLQDALRKAGVQLTSIQEIEDAIELLMTR